MSGDDIQLPPLCSEFLFAREQQKADFWLAHHASGFALTPFDDTNICNLDPAPSFETAVILELETCGGIIYPDDDNEIYQDDWDANHPDDPRPILVSRERGMRMFKLMGSAGFAEIVRIWLPLMLAANSDYFGQVNALAALACSLMPE